MRCFIDFCLQTGETRVWRTYVGGARLNEWHGRKAEQGFFPEDWAASTTRAVNAGREDLVEGLSRVVSMPDQPYLLDLIQKDPEAFFGNLQGIELGNPDENAQGFREGYHDDHHYPGVLRRFRLRRCV